MFLRCEIRDADNIAERCSMAGPPGHVRCGACVGRRAPRARHQRIFATPAHHCGPRNPFSIYLLFTTLRSETQGPERRQQYNKVQRIRRPHTHIGHRPTNSSYNRRPEDSTSATQVPSRDSPGTAIIQPRSASVLGHGVPRSSEFHS
jgi:hypothetical protein